MVSNINISNREKSWIYKNASKRDLKEVREFLKSKKPINRKPKVDKRKTPGMDNCIGRLRPKLIANATEAEKELYSLLTVLDVDFEMQKAIVINGKLYFADTFLPKSKAVIELDGGYHKTSEMRIKDKIRTQNIIKLGYKVIRYDNDRVFSRVNFIEDLVEKANLRIDAYKYI